MTNKKKKGKVKKPKIIIPYTKEERLNPINQLKMKLEMVGVSQITNNIDEIKTAFNNFVENGIEFNDKIKLHGAKYIVDMKLMNNNKKTAEIFLKYNETI